MVYKYIILLFICSTVKATTYYVAPVDSGGNDSNPGTFASPWATFQTGIDSAIAGDTVYFRGGIYNSMDRNEINPEEGVGVTGTAANPICYFGYPGEWPVFDCIQHCTELGGVNNNFLNLHYVEHIQFKDFEVRSVHQCDSNITQGIAAYHSINLTFNHIVLHEMGMRGFEIAGGAWKAWYEKGGTEIEPYWDTYYDSTYFINCDVYNLCDTFANNPGNGADGFITNHYEGNYVLFEGCRIWHYSDDGVDVHIDDGAEYIFNNCWIMASAKYDVYGIEGNGLKISAAVDSIETPVFFIKNCLALFCPYIGFYNDIFIQLEDHYSNNARFYNNTAYGCGYGYCIIDYPGRDIQPMYINNISHNSTERNFVSSYSQGLIEHHNTWQYKPGSYPGSEPSDTVTVTDADFLTTDSATLVTLFTAPRQADGSLPEIKPLQLASSSDLINAGYYVGIDTSGAGADIGYHEYDTTGQGGVELGTAININFIPSVYSVNVTGNAIDNGGGTISNKGICWATSTNPTTSNSNYSGGAGTGVFSTRAKILFKDTKYYFRSFVTNEAGTSYSAQDSITTKTEAVTVNNGQLILNNGQIILIK